MIGIKSCQPMIGKYHLSLLRVNRVSAFKVDKFISFNMDPKAPGTS